MAKRRTKKTVKEQHSTTENDSNNTQEEELLHPEKQLCLLSEHEVERRITAIRAIRDAEIEHLLTQLRLLRSYFSTEQLETPALQFFTENLPSLSVIKNEKDGQLELEWKRKDNDLPSSRNNEGNVPVSVIQRTSIGHPDFGTAFPAASGFQFSSEAGDKSWSLILTALELKLRFLLLKQLIVPSKPFEFYCQAALAAAITTLPPMLKKLPDCLKPFRLLPSFPMSLRKEWFVLQFIPVVESIGIISADIQCHLNGISILI
ncbi:hypothetical protein ACLOJK_039344 [Asimina triloba]